MITFNRRFMLWLRISAGAISMLLIAGCISADPRPTVDSLQETVAARTGHRVVWLSGPQEEQEISTIIHAALQTNLTAETAARIAVLNNRTLQAQFAELGIAQADLAQASRLRNPTFTGFARAPIGGGGLLNLEGEIAQDFLDLLALPTRKRVASANLQAAKQRAAQAVLDTIAEAKIAFYTVQANQQLIARLEGIAQVTEAAADLSTRQYKAGNINDLELANQGASYQEAKLELGKTRAQLRSARERLNRALGLWGDNTGWTLADSLPPLPETEADLAQVETFAVQQRLDLMAARTQLASLEASLRLQARLRYLPGATIGVNAERDTDGSRVLGPTLDLQLPVFDQGQPAVARLMAQYRQAQSRLDALATDIRADVRQARDSLTTARDLALFYQKVYLPQRQRIVNETQLQYNAMQDGPLQLILARERQLAAEREYTEAWRDYWIARAELEKAVGGRLDLASNAQPFNTLSPREREGMTGQQQSSDKHEHHHQ